MPFTGHWFYLVIILIIALVIFGPGKLPEVGSGLGRAIREFKKATTETTDTVRAAVQEEPRVQSPAAAPVVQSPAAAPVVQPSPAVSSPAVPVVPVVPVAEERPPAP